MDRPPRPAPYPVGTRVRYTGILTLYRSAEDKTPIFTTGMEFTVSEIRPGRRGTLRQLTEDDGSPAFWEDTGEPILDETRDGWSVVEVGGFRRRIPVDSPDWQPV